MAVQTTPHTQKEQDVNSAEMDLEPNMNPQDSLRSDPKLYENSDGAQTAGNRSFHSTAGRDNQPKSIDEGTGNDGAAVAHSCQRGEGSGITSHSGNVEKSRAGEGARQVVTYDQEQKRAPRRRRPFLFGNYSAAVR